MERYVKQNCLFSCLMVKNSSAKIFLLEFLSGYISQVIVFCCPHRLFRLYSLVFNKVYKTAHISLGFADYLQFDYISKYCANTVNDY